MKKLFFSFCLLLIFNTAFFAQISHEEYSVYAAALSGIFADDETPSSGQTKLLMILGETSSDPDNSSPVIQGVLSRSLRSDFSNKNQIAYKLERSIPTGFSYRLIDANETKTIVGLNSIELENKYPHSDGYYQFSRVGFSVDGKFALVSVIHRGIANGFDQQYLLKNINGKWVVKKNEGGAWAAEGF